MVEVPAQNSFPPNEVRDLRAESLDPSTLSLTWTAPGDDLDSGTGVVYNFTKTNYYEMEIKQLVIGTA